MVMKFLTRDGWSTLLFASRIRALAKGSRKRRSKSTVDWAAIAPTGPQSVACCVAASRIGADLAPERAAWPKALDRMKRLCEGEQAEAARG